VRGSRVEVLVCAVVALASLTPGVTAKAQATDAAATFDFGLAEMLAGRYATGCPAIEASFRADPRPGTLFTLADCDRKWGRTASALARFGEYLALYDRMPADQQAKQRARATAAASERAALEKSVPLLSVRLPDGAPAGTRVWRDDVELASPSLGAAVPVDPGEHVIRTQLADGRAAQERITIESGEQRTLVAVIPEDPARVDVAPPPIAVPPPKPRTPSAPVPTAPPAEGSSSHAGWIYATGGVGVVSLVVAGVTGVVALSARSKVSDACNAQGMCTTQEGVSSGNEAHTFANVETGALVVGGVTLAAALVLWLIEPRASARDSKVGVAPGGLRAAW
jgi:hypothetical protein